MLINEVISQKEFSHLKHKLPNSDFSQLLDHIYRIKEQFLLYSKAKHKTSESVLAHFKINELLNINMEIMGLKIPIPFMIYDNFHLVCHENFDVLLCNKAYRDKLGQQKQSYELRKKQVTVEKPKPNLKLDLTMMD